MWRRVDLVWTDVSEERNASIFRAEKSVCEEPAWAGGCRFLLTLVPRPRIFLPWRWRRYVPPKRRFAQDLHGATSQKAEFFSMKHLVSLHEPLDIKTCRGAVLGPWRHLEWAGMLETSFFPALRSQNFLQCKPTQYHDIGLPPLCVSTQT
jgi:hypothetical protein